MRKVSIALVLILLLMTPSVVEASESSTSEVAWQLTGCWFEIDIGGDGYEWLGSYSSWGYGDQIDNETTPNDATPQEVTVRSSCNGYTVNVEPIQFDLPSNHLENEDTAIEDFGIKGDNTLIPDNYEYFSSIDDSKQLKNRDNAGTSNLSMYYRYKLDQSDVPGSYVVYLRYTASTQ